MVWRQKERKGRGRRAKQRRLILFEAGAAFMVVAQVTYGVGVVLPDVAKVNAALSTDEVRSYLQTNGFTITAAKVGIFLYIFIYFYIFLFQSILDFLTYSNIHLAAPSNRPRPRQQLETLTPRGTRARAG